MSGPLSFGALVALHHFGGQRVAHFGGVILDPPRKGLGPEIVKSLLASAPGRVIYLSCNPTTLARDLKALSPAYALRTIRGYDFFPHTPHIEALAVLERG